MAMHMHHSFTIPAVGPNNPFPNANNPAFPPNNSQFDPNMRSSFPMFQQSPSHPFLPPYQQSAQHVFQNNSQFPNPMPAPFLPDLNVIKSMPPPSVRSPALASAYDNRVSQSPSPAWNPSPGMDNKHFNQQCNPFSQQSVEFNHQSGPFSHQSGPFNQQSGPLTHPLNTFNHQSNPFNQPSGQFNQPSGPFNQQSITFKQLPNTFDERYKAFKHKSNPFKHESDSYKYESNSFKHGSNPFKHESNPYKRPPDSPIFRPPRPQSKNYDNRKIYPSSNGSYPGSNNQKNSPGYLPSRPNHQNTTRSNGQGRIKIENNFNVSKPYCCDTCDRGFASEDELKCHISEHKKCDYGNCQFEAHPKIVALHKKMQHDTGYADAINKLKNADEIEKWRAERRRRFPTAENISKRLAEQAEREARGEVIENKDFGKFKKKDMGRNGNRTNPNPKRRRQCFSGSRTGHPHSVSQVTISLSESDSDDDSHIKLPKFLGMNAPERGSLDPSSEELAPNSEEMEDDEPKDKISNLVTEINSEDEPPIELPPLEINKSAEQDVKSGYNISDSVIDVNSDDALPIELTGDIPHSSICNSVIDVNSDDESTLEIPIRKVAFPTEQSNKKDDLPQSASCNSVVDVDSDDDSPMEVPIRKVAFPTDQNNQKDAKTGKNYSKARTNREYTNKKEYPSPPRKSTLLEKLLDEDIRRERNKIMQCVRHVVQKKFFGIGADN